MRRSPRPQGATASANRYSLIVTAKANNIEPYRYLRHLFIELPKAESLEAIESLLPKIWQGEQKSACWARRGWLIACRVFAFRAMSLVKMGSQLSVSA
jgi:hypothetical protein